METEKTAMPRGLLQRVLRRLGLEQQARLVRRNLGFFTAASVGLLLLLIFAYIGLRHVLAESSFGAFMVLVLSDRTIVLANAKTFFLSIAESVPSASIALFLLPLALLLLLVKFIGARLEKLLLINQSITQQKNGNK